MFEVHGALDRSAAAPECGGPPVALLMDERVNQVLEPGNESAVGWKVVVGANQGIKGGVSRESFGDPSKSVLMGGYIRIEEDQQISGGTTGGEIAGFRRSETAACRKNGRAMTLGDCGRIVGRTIVHDKAFSCLPSRVLDGSKACGQSGCAVEYWNDDRNSHGVLSPCR